MAIPEDIINEIKYRNDIETVISQYVTLKRRGKNLVGLCPFHGEKTPSFTVYPETASFYCFGCGVGGDVFTFTGLIENLDYIESIKLLAEKYDFYYVDLFSFLFNLETNEIYDEYTVDGAHFTSKGYEVVTGLVTPVLEEILGD